MVRRVTARISLARRQVCANVFVKKGEDVVKHYLSLYLSSCSREADDTIRPEGLNQRIRFVHFAGYSRASGARS